MPTPDPTLVLRAAVDAADRLEETRELNFYAAAECALTAKQEVRRVLGEQMGLDGERLGPRGDRAPLLMRQLGHTLAAALDAKRAYELAAQAANAARRAL